MAQGFGGMATHVEWLRKQLTPARIRGLQVLAQTGEARVSNITTTLPPSVYWQTARWLYGNGLANLTDYGRQLRITPTGRQLVEAMAR